ncbi:carboxypeptidase M32 [Myxococcota bacterium]|nr:carboxypeptidase M32 [Myxococcota bacterium]
MHELKDLDGVLGLMSWDEETHAPKLGRAARGQQTATIEAIRHQRLVDPALGELIADNLADASLPWAKQVMVRRLARRRALATKIPESLVKALAETRSVSLDAWQRARAENRFDDFAPHLAETFRLLRAKAEALGGGAGGPYDALLDEYEPEMKVSALRPVLAELRDGLVPIVSKILGSGRTPDRSFLTSKRFDTEKQWQLTLRLLRDLGFDFDAGRQDRSAHPFTGSCSERDVRLTTRIFEDNPLSAIFSTIHECGHGLYEQGFAPELHRTSLAEAPSMGIHESQSRLWENQIGRSRAFWRHYLPVLREYFPAELQDVELEAMYRAVNVVEATPIRVEADEVTYNLHILVRFELEVPLLEGALDVRDLPSAWGAKMREYLGITPKNDAEGCLQDIHWGWGAVGYFPTYSLGNLYSAQLMAAYEKSHPGIWTDVEAGRFGPLLGWLREHIHVKGHLDSAEATVKSATGEALRVEPFLAYLRAKYGELYGF